MSDKAEQVLRAVLSYTRPKAKAAVAALAPQAVAALEAIDLEKPDQAPKVHAILDASRKRTDKPEPAPELDEPTDVV
jgi:hypothetical protein